MREIVVDFEVTPPATMRLAFAVPWLPVVVSSLVVALGVLAIYSTRRVVLAWCWVLVLLSFGAVILFHQAVELSCCLRISSMTGA